MTDMYPTTLAEWRQLEYSLKDCAPEKAIAVCRRMCRTSLYFLIRYGLDRRDIEHPWLLDRCTEVGNAPNGYLDLWAREHYKSTIITFALTIQDILASHGEDSIEDREVTIGIFSHTRPIAKKFLRQIQQELETNPTSPIQRWKCRNWLIYRCRRQKVGTTERLVKRTGVGSLR